ncbi:MULTISPECIES: hypothetical protein [Helcobacillus]|uniref:Uncharacterized protein n=1 Tax=Helcobacillus massiliensis TaxID=521392 RepID=A0A839QRK8_9MICO|nr:MULTISPECIES: hypothetical protein [Helcobacillus]MBB3022405.1 hypothetical protein [Helcobacillus massiliensis]MCG7426951.1 hypothetical protein [Helcobacillus sp. ACRRO]MDK7741111.1 hypothetical protein [Helcobacillus massiliensis]WOO93920.1 hypothetical protein R3I40_04885 [Helcobacillus massiliensis]
MSIAFDDRLARAQAVLSTAEARVSGLTGGIRRPVETGSLPVPSALASVLAGLRPGSSVAVTGSTSLLLALAGAAMGEESWCAVIGMPHLGLGAVADLGVDPARLALLPDPGASISQLVSAMIDGVDVVVIGSAVSDQLWRAAISRARAQDTLLLAADPPGRADLRISADHVRWRGLRRGSGRLRHHDVAVAVTNRGLPSGRVDITLPSVSGAMVVSPLTTAASAPASSAPSRSKRPALSIVRSA